MTARHSGPRVGAFNFALFAWMGVFVPYFPLWLKGRGLDPTAIGVLLGIAPWLRLVLNPTLGPMADRRDDARPFSLVFRSLDLLAPEAFFDWSANALSMAASRAGRDAGVGGDGPSRPIRVVVGLRAREDRSGPAPCGNLWVPTPTHLLVR